MTVTDFGSTYGFPARPVSTTVASRPRPHRRLTIPRPDVTPRLLVAVVAAVLLFSIAVLGTMWIDTARGSWYSALDAPPAARAAPTFLGLGWAGVCATAAIGLWRVTQRRDRRGAVVGALVAWLAQLVLLLAWVWTMFVGHALERSMVVAIAMIVASTVTIGAFGRVSRIAGALMIPALAWSVAITALTGGLVVLN